MKLYHVSLTKLEDENEKVILNPRIPTPEEYWLPEDTTIPRVSFSTTINHCLDAVEHNFIDEIGYVYSIDTSKIPEPNLVSPEGIYDKDYVLDAMVHQEWWVINQSVEMCSEGIIKVTSGEVDDIIVVYTKRLKPIIESFAESIEDEELDLSNAEDFEYFMNENDISENEYPWSNIAVRDWTYTSEP